MLLLPRLRLFALANKKRVDLGQAPRARKVGDVPRENSAPVIFFSQSGFFGVQSERNGFDRQTPKKIKVESEDQPLADDGVPIPFALVAAASRGRAPLSPLGAGNCLANAALKISMNFPSVSSSSKTDASRSLMS